MDKLITRFSAVFMCFFLVSALMPCNAAGAEEKHRYNDSYVLAEVSTGTVINEYKSDIRVHMGSFNKLMTLLLAAEAMDRGEISFDTVLTASENANSKNGAQIWLMTGEKITFLELLKGVIIGNANDAACVIAEKIGGTEEKFTEMMNSRAAELGMKNTLFTECTGYYGDDAQYTTASDAALLLCELSKHDELTDIFTTRLDEVKNGSVQLVTTNTLCHRYKGSLGFKCGAGPNSGYFAAECAERDGCRYTVIVLDCEDEETALDKAKQLLDSAFSGYSVISLGIPDDLPDFIAVKQGREPQVMIMSSPAGNAVVSRGSEGKISARVMLPSYVYAPLEKGDKIGELRYYLGDRLIRVCDLKAASDAEEKSTFNILSEMLKCIVIF